MLVLTRRIGEVTKVSGGIEVQVLQIRGRQVRLGWTAPATIKIHRKEICNRTECESASTHGSRGRTTDLIGSQSPKK